MSSFGPGCAAVPKSGQLQRMSTAPVAIAASANPALSTPVTAVKAAGLVDTLNSASNITAFTPDNAAFAKVLTYHVAPARHTPAQLSSGAAIKTLEGGTVTRPRWAAPMRSTPLTRCAGTSRPPTPPSS
jgi:uncharacterized surface protein with fasciclin (FAS1) repeats